MQYNFSIQRFDSLGNQHWSDEGISIDTSFVSQATRIAASPDNNVYVYIMDTDTLSNLYKIDDEGEIQWIQEISRYPRHLQSDCDFGSYVLYPTYLDNTFSGHSIMRLDSSGQHIWPNMNTLYSLNSLGANSLIVSDCTTGIFVAYDQASTVGQGTGIYINKIDKYGVLGGQNEGSCLKGDLDQDGLINILDILVLVNIVLDSGYQYTALEHCYCDVNNDHYIDINDIISIMLLII